jgi:ribonuclease HI
LIKKKECWTLYFDGSKSNEGAGAGCVLIDPSGNKTLMACRLEFDCTNNVAEYEALIQGLRKEIDLKIKGIRVVGDSEIVIKQVKNMIHCVSNRLKNYQHKVMNLIDHFEAFDIISVPRALNVEADLLANVASRLIPLTYFSPDKFSG